MLASYSREEKLAGVFVWLAIGGTLLFFVILGVKRGWLRSRVHFNALAETSEGIRVGTDVEMAGLKIGHVDSLNLNNEGLVVLGIGIFGEFRDRVREGSRIQLIRPYVVGDKVIYLVPGPMNGAILQENARLESEEVLGLTDILNGRKLVPYMKTLGNAFEGLREIIDALTANRSPGQFAKMLQDLPVLIRELTQMTHEITRVTHQVSDTGHLKSVLRNMASVSESLSNSSPDFGRDIGKLMANLADLTGEMKKLTPAIAEIAPDLPKTSRRMVEAINEMVVVLKALQRSFLLSGSSREVKEEEAKANQQKPTVSEPRDPTILDRN